MSKESVMTLHDQFQKICQIYPQNIAYECDSDTSTYAELAKKVDHAVASLSELGVQRGARVAIAPGRPLPVFTLELACSKIGATLVFLESFMSPNSMEWQEAIEGASAHWVVTWSEEDTAQWCRSGIPDDSEIWHRPILLQARTSGTTGKSKGVCLSESALLQAVRNTQTIANCSPESRGMLLYEPLGLLSQIAAFSTLLAGATLVDGLAVADAPEKMAEFLEKKRISHLVMVPQHISATLSDPQLMQRDLSHLEVVMYGAAPVTQELMQRARASISCRWLQCYGMTETTGPVCWLSNEEQELAGFSVGRAAAGCNLRICDPESGKVVQPGVTGEVQIGGVLLMEGYWDNDCKKPVSGKTIVDGWLWTGDLGALTEDGHLLLRGRASDEIVCALGYTIKPSEIEDALSNTPEILGAAAFGFEIGDVGVVPVVVCQVKSDNGEQIRQLIRETFQRNLDRSKHPTHFALVEQPLPRGSNGKVQKSRLKTQTTERDLVAL